MRSIPGGNLLFGLSFWLRGNPITKGPSVGHLLLSLHRRLGGHPSSRFENSKWRESSCSSRKKFGFDLVWALSEIQSLDFVFIDLLGLNRDCMVNGFDPVGLEHRVLVKQGREIITGYWMIRNCMGEYFLLYSTRFDQSSQDKQGNPAQNKRVRREQESS